MAGDKLYLGQILGQLKQDTQDYSATLQTMITELRNVKIAVTSNITEVNVIPSDNLKASLNHSAKSVNVNNSTVADYNLLTAHCLARGIVRIRFVFITNTGADYVYVKSGGDYMQSKLVSNGATAVFDVPVNAGKYIVIGVRVGGNGLTYGIAANSLKVYYDIVDIVNGSAISVVSD
ncbi:MAG: hypothetical protein AB9836_03460 [Aminipila sp.]